MNIVTYRGRLWRDNEHSDIPRQAVERGNEHSDILTQAVERGNEHRDIPTQAAHRTTQIDSVCVYCWLTGVGLEVSIDESLSSSDRILAPLGEDRLQFVVIHRLRG